MLRLAGGSWGVKEGRAACKVAVNGRRGPEEYSGGLTSVNGIPTAILQKLRGRVEVVPPITELRGIPLEPWMQTDGN